MNVGPAQNHLHSRRQNFRREMPRNSLYEDRSSILGWRQAANRFHKARILDRERPFVFTQLSAGRCLAQELAKREQKKQDHAEAFQCFLWQQRRQLSLERCGDERDKTGNSEKRYVPEKFVSVIH